MLLNLCKIFAVAVL